MNICINYFKDSNIKTKYVSSQLHNAQRMFLFLMMNNSYKMYDEWSLKYQINFAAMINCLNEIFLYIQWHASIFRTDSFYVWQCIHNNKCFIGFSEYFNGGFYLLALKLLTFFFFCLDFMTKARRLVTLEMKIFIIFEKFNFKW